MNENSILTEKSYQLALKTCRMLQKLQKDQHEYNLSNQLIRSITSIYANIEESKGAGSRRDFIAKLVISRKEAYESTAWFRLLVGLEYVKAIEVEDLVTELIVVIKILHKSIGTAKARI